MKRTAMQHPDDALGYTAMTRKASLGFITLIAALFVSAALALAYLCVALDDEQVRHSEQDAAKAMQSRWDKVETALVDYAFWEDAYRLMGEKIDVSWAYERNNIGPSLFTTYELDGVFVLDRQAVTRYGLIDGELTDTRASDWIDGDLPALLAAAREVSADDRPAHAYFSVSGMPAIVCAAVIRPDNTYNDFDRLSYLVFVDVLTTAKMHTLDRAFDLDGLNASLGGLPNAPGPKLTLRTDLGVTVTLRWRSEALGKTLLKRFLPMLLVLGLLVALLVGWLRRRVARAAALIDAAQQALRVSEQRFRNICEASSDWIWETDAQQRLTYLSERFTQVTGLACHAWLGRPLSELLNYDNALLAAYAEAGELSGRKPLACLMRDSEDAQRYGQLSARAVWAGSVLQGYLGTVSDNTDEIEAKAHIEHISQHDALTGLANRHRLNRILNDRLADGVSGDRPLFLLALDLDRFKPVNDTLGHAAGDVVLRQVAGALTDCTRSTDLVARLGGDEFIIVATGCNSREQAGRLCGRLIEQINQPIRIGNADVSVGASIGIACAPFDGLIAEDLLRYADIALYEAKSNGRNQHRFYEPAMNERIMERRQLELDMRQALRRHEFRLDFQPRYDASSQLIVGAEALVRWQHPTRGLLTPGSFIGLAEETGLIVELSDWVLAEACRNALSWADELMVSVNLSPVEFQRSDLDERIEAVLTASGIAPARLELEITESVMLEDAASALATMNRLKALGVRLSMDDFGTGYSSLSYLRNYPFDGIKIDRSFVAALDQSQGSEAIVSAIVSMGHALSLTVTAEGIETRAQLGTLKALACDQAQGFYLGRPMAPMLFRQIVLDQDAGVAATDPPTAGCRVEARQTSAAVTPG